MPPRPPIPHLPPLPPSSSWHTYFPRRLLAVSQIDPAWVLRGRTLLTNKEHCDAFVRAINIRPGEVVVEVNPGVGLLTRSVLEGGAGVSDDEAWKAWSDVRGEEGDKVPMGRMSKLPVDKRRKKPVVEESPGVWPAWSRDVDPTPSRRKRPQSTLSPSSSPPIPDPELRKPAVVAAVEPCLPLLERAFNHSSAIKSKGETSSEIVYESFVATDHNRPLLDVQHSAYHPNLLLSESSAYRWPTLPSILEHPLLAPYLGSGKRKWEDAPPKITIVANIPDGVNGEQMLAQWIGSAVGGEKGRQWIWQWGRVRLAILCGKGLYDRIMARPRETINCKLSVMSSSLFHRRPLPPYHHVRNVDKSGKRTFSHPIKATPTSKTTLLPIIDSSEGDWVDDHTTTYPGDFYPPSGQSIDTRPLARPTLMGVLLSPRLESPIIPSQKDAWDYVLRNCFIRETQPLAEAAKNLGFGAENLLDRFADDAEGHEGRWRGRPVVPKTRVKDLSNDEWARVVDVFDKWAFKPDTLLLASDVGMDVGASRDMGTD